MMSDLHENGEVTKISIKTENITGPGDFLPLFHCTGPGGMKTTLFIAIMQSCV